MPQSNSLMPVNRFPLWELIPVEVDDSSFQFFPLHFQNQYHCTPSEIPASTVQNLYFRGLCSSSKRYLLCAPHTLAPTPDSASSKGSGSKLPRALPSGFQTLRNPSIPFAPLAQGVGAASYYYNLCDVSVFSFCLFTNYLH